MDSNHSNQSLRSDWRPPHLPKIVSCAARQTANTARARSAQRTIRACCIGAHRVSCAWPTLRDRQKVDAEPAALQVRHLGDIEVRRELEQLALPRGVVQRDGREPCKMAATLSKRH